MERSGKVSFGGAIREVNLAFVPEAQKGDYVLVHVGLAISKIDDEQAREVFECLQQMDSMDLGGDL